MTSTCDPCQSAGATCINPKESRSTSPLSSSSRRGSHPGLPGRKDLRSLIDAYFVGPHFYCFYTFLHQPTLMQIFEADTIPSCLLLIIAATSLHFLEPRNPLPDTWADECRTQLIGKEIFSPPSTTTLQALLLLQRYEWHRASHISAWLLSGLAIRLAHGLQLNIEVDGQVQVLAVVREVRRRLTWSCAVMESMIEAGRSPLGKVDVQAIEIKVPCNEASFQGGFETAMPVLDGLFQYEDARQGMSEEERSVNRPGISAFLVKLTALRRDILNYTLPYHPRNRGHMPSERPWALDSPFYSYEARLREWHFNLPPDLAFSQEILHSRRTQLVTYITLHCLFHGCYCDLYRIGGSLQAAATTDTAPPQDFVARCRLGRVQHAMEICKVIWHGIQHHQSGHDPVVGICASLAIRVLVIERQPEDLSVTNERMYEYLDAAVRCGAEISKRSVPIRDLVSRTSLCEKNADRKVLLGLHTGKETWIPC